MTIFRVIIALAARFAVDSYWYASCR